jgi:hypothetical protein
MPVVLALFWHHLDVGGENVAPLGNQAPKVITVAFDGDINEPGFKVLVPIHKLDPGPDRPFARILEPDPESRG